MKTSVDSESNHEWEIWYQDVFDRECPRSIEIQGYGLINGLKELWLRHLYETVREDGTAGFSRFNLWLKPDNISIKVEGNWEGLLHIRSWIFLKRSRKIDNYRHCADTVLLLKVAESHYNLIMDGLTSERICEVAVESQNRIEFVEKLKAVQM